MVCCCLDLQIDVPGGTLAFVDAEELLEAKAALREFAEQEGLGWVLAELDEAVALGSSKSRHFGRPVGAEDRSTRRCARPEPPRAAESGLRNF